jgi:dienelactone hydrolase
MTVAACLFLLAQVAHGEFTYKPTPAEPEVPALFRLESALVPYASELRRNEPGVRVSAVRFPSPIVSPDPVNNTVHAEYFQVEPARAGLTNSTEQVKPVARPAVVVLHILGADFALSRFVAMRLAQHGVHALFVKLPYYGERRPPGVKFLSPDLERSSIAMRQGICDVRRALGWLAARTEVDAGRLGVTGISLGGIVSALVASVDPSVHAAGLLLAGGDLAQILWTMPEAEPYRKRWIEAGKTKADLEALVDPYDPLRYADRLKGKRVLMMAATADEVVPPECTRRLWEKAGRPPIRWMNCGHYSAVAYLIPAVRDLAEFFAAGSRQTTEGG